MSHQQKIVISSKHLNEINSLLTHPKLKVMEKLYDVVKKYGTPEEINEKARHNSEISVLLEKLQKVNPVYINDLLWLKSQRDVGAFVSVKDYARRILGSQYKRSTYRKNSVVLEISSLQYFPWLIEEAKQAIKKRELMPGRFIRVRNMKEQEKDGDLLAVSAAMKLLGASLVETLDTKGTDGSNIHLGGADTITGYFGGVGEPNEYVLKWIDEFLYYYTTYGVQEVLNVNPGTIMAGYLLYKMGVDIHFKISVFMGNDNPYAGLWTMIGAKLFARKDGTTPLIGFNWSNSVNNETLEEASQIRKILNFEKEIRFEHHITEAYRHIVRQPYNRREELLRVAKNVPNISAKHEGGEIATEKNRNHSSSILDYFMPKAAVEKEKLMADMKQNYLDKHDAVNLTAKALIKHNIDVVAAPKLHCR